MYASKWEGWQREKSFKTRPHYSGTEKKKKEKVDLGEDQDWMKYRLEIERPSLLSSIEEVPTSVNKLNVQVKMRNEEWEIVVRVMKKRTDWISSSRHSYGKFQAAPHASSYEVSK